MTREFRWVPCEDANHRVLDAAGDWDNGHQSPGGDLLNREFPDYILFIQ